MKRLVGISLSNGMVHGELHIIRGAADLAEVASQTRPDKILLAFETTPDLPTFIQAVHVPAITGFIIPECSPYSHLAWAISYFNAATIVFDVKLLPRKIGPIYLDLDRAAIIIPSNRDEEETLTVEELERIAGCEEIRSRAHTAATSRAGSTIKVLSQIQSVEDVRLAYDNGADGIGELKPEIVFDTEGSNSGMADVIHAIRTTTPWQTIPIRFFDFTSDKPSPDGTVASQSALAFRGIRLCEIYDFLIERFLLGLDRVAAPDIVIVLPMVTLPYEVEAFRDRVSKQRLRVGILVETPAAALVIEDFLNLCDYIEIGINDLTQFTMAWDRTIPHRLRLPSDRVVEPVARLISTVSRAAERKKVFSALAVDLRPTTELASQLVGLGVTAITVSPRLIPLWKEAVRNS